MVAGYVNKGESAEDAVEREIGEELGMKVTDISYNHSRYFDKSNTLMLNFSCVASDEWLGGVTDEVDKAEWFKIDEARETIKRNSLAQAFLERYLAKCERLSLGL